MDFSPKPKLHFILTLKKMDSLITLYLVNSLAFHPFQSSSSLVFWILPPNFNLTSLLHWKSFLMESLITFCLVLRKKTQTHTLTQSYQLPKPPHRKNVAWYLCLTYFLPSTICNDECWKQNLHFVVIDGWNGSKTINHKPSTLKFNMLTIIYIKY